MRLGAPIYIEYQTPEEWVEAVRDKGYGTALCPIQADAPLSEINACERMAAKHDIIIGARCCVNIAGSKNPQRWDGPHPDNFAQETFEEVVASVRYILDTVKPKRTYYTLEPMAWAIPDTADSYLELIQAVDRNRFAVHLDIVNVIRTPREHYENADLIREWFKKLGPHICSCYAKDTVIEARYTSHTGEAAPGKGTLDYGVLLREIEALDPDMPLMIEHLETEEEYDTAARYIRGVAAREGIGLK